MRYFIVNKIENVGGELTFTEVGYVTDINDCATINEKYESTLGQWFTDNTEGLTDGSVTISGFFDVTPYIYNAKDEISSIEESDLVEITDVTTL
jgi:hypothetical protein|tara:strand:- start:305 stop:586 length:282 start_codon:yes stop_codon:yes gene_type:complete